MMNANLEGELGSMLRAKASKFYDHVSIDLGADTNCQMFEKNGHLVGPDVVFQATLTMCSHAANRSKADTLTPAV